MDLAAGLADLPLPALLALGGIVLFAGLVHGTLGLGFPLVSTPLIALFLDVRAAILVTLLPTAAEDTGDVHRGGVIASIVGTFQVIGQADAERIKGFMINNFHGDIELFRAGMATIEDTIDRPGIGIIPETTALNDAVRGNRIKRRASRMTRRFNNKLERAMRYLERDTGVDIVLLDLFGVIGEILKDADARGFQNIAEPCFDSEIQQFMVECENGSAFDEFVFFDWIHPTARAHAIAGRIMYAYAPVVD